MDLKDKRILITGASGRLGSAMALSLAQSGAKLILHYNHSFQEMNNCVASILLKANISEKNIQTIQADFGNDDQLNHFFDQACSLYGGIDVLINNASLYPDHHNNDHSYTDEEILKINNGVPLYFSHFLSSGLVSDTTSDFASRVIINMLDARINDKALPSDSAYLVSKRKLSNQTKKLARELAPAIRVNGIAPGLILPPLGMLKGGERYLKEREKFNPLHITPSVDNIIETLLLLLHNDAITGQSIFVDGGRHLKEFNNDF